MTRLRLLLTRAQRKALPQLRFDGQRKRRWWATPTATRAGC